MLGAGGLRSPIIKYNNFFNISKPITNTSKDLRESVTK